MHDYGDSVNAANAIPASPPPRKRLSSRELVRVVVVLESKRADLVAVGLDTADLDRQLRSARGRLIAGEFNIPPRDQR